jgi:2-keto-4-pentenoate hydratase/2-oxohepta-3-ene-1,7-dioic acid hydratase in catechol pathway
MRWCRYHHDGTVAFGLLDGQNVEEVDGSPFDGYIATGVRRRLADIRLLTPCLPPTFYCAGLNYKAHIEWGERRRNIRIPIPDRPDIGYRAQSALTAPDSPIVIPARSSGEVHYEGELVAVIGRTARRVTQDEALDYVLGYTMSANAHGPRRTERFGGQRTRIHSNQWARGFKRVSIRRTST